jgi:hypothetical protein
MSAVATEYHPISGWTYAAGIWLETILVDLFWQLDEEFSGLRNAQTRSWPTTQKFQTYRAPSWSWTAIDGLIKPGYKQDFFPDAQIAEVIDLLQWYHPGAPFGWVLSCTLVIKAQLCPIHELSDDYYELEAYELDGRLTFDFEPSEEDREACNPVWLVNTVSDASSNESNEDEKKGIAAGLLVIPAEVEENSWRRVGIFHSVLPEKFNGQPKQKLKLI